MQRIKHLANALKRSEMVLGQRMLFRDGLVDHAPMTDGERKKVTIK
jgi:hypothetical protein